ncbi:hypothetical protein PHLGIDRAFT_417762 [Phlebiopsis gigantea 11061_1 CR5-6]|uniref:Uncharacterized protein n=1 Tax=Phlebiopsis gigantea (strain 11061_1 CR5-6) TaxID=745531 RepID=A0A0C3SFC8_PHLG1|nr:hypothetical protein PHLGIDRAFT_417762 [Phlebiopsis gigantea 11061_1 CR5-6]
MGIPCSTTARSDLAANDGSSGLQICNPPQVQAHSVIGHLSTAAHVRPGNLGLKYDREAPAIEDGLQICLRREVQHAEVALSNGQVQPRPKAFLRVAIRNNVRRPLRIAKSPGTRPSLSLHRHKSTLTLGRAGYEPLRQPFADLPVQGTHAPLLCGRSRAERCACARRGSRIACASLFRPAAAPISRLGGMFANGVASRPRLRRCSPSCIGLLVPIPRVRLWPSPLAVIPSSHSGARVVVACSRGAILHAQQGRCH